VRIDAGDAVFGRVLGEAGQAAQGFACDASVMPVVFGTVNAGRSDYFDAIHLLEALVVRFPESVRHFITGRSPLGAAPELLSKSEGIKNVIRFDGATSERATSRERDS